MLVLFSSQVTSASGMPIFQVPNLVSLYLLLPFGFPTANGKPSMSCLLLHGTADCGSCL